MSCSALSNAKLDESPLSSEAYNSLPDIDAMTRAGDEHQAARASLLALINAHGAGDKFSVHLVHKHFEVPDGRVMVYEPVKGQGHPDFLLCSSRDPLSFAPGSLRGLYFRARHDGTMAAYEYTTEAGPDLSGYEHFVLEFARRCIDPGVENIFALSARQATPKPLSEFEFSAAKATILVPTGT